jgi:hypothetical protein
MEHREVTWEPAAVTITRHYRTGIEDYEETVYLWRLGGLSLGFGAGPGMVDDHVEQEWIGTRFNEWLATGREILVELGGHGDLRVNYAVNLAGGLRAEGGVYGKRDEVGFVRAERWTSLDPDADRDELLRASIIDDFRRAVGFAPIT